MSRGLSDRRERYPRSAATEKRTPEGCWIRFVATEVFHDPSGVGFSSMLLSGGITSFNPRLISGIPPGWEARQRFGQQRPSCATLTASWSGSCSCLNKTCVAADERRLQLQEEQSLTSAATLLKMAQPPTATLTSPLHWPTARSST